MGNEKVDLQESSLWPCVIVKCFIDIMVEEVNKGNMKNGVFTTRTWNGMLNTLNIRTNRTFTMKQVKQKYNRLRSKHGQFSHLLKQTGFGWNAEKNTVVADESVWQTYLAVHTKLCIFCLNWFGLVISSNLNFL